MKRILLIEKCSAKNWFSGILSDMEIKIDEKQFPNSIFFFKDGECFMEHDKRNEIFLICYDKIWSIFRTEFRLNHREINLLIKGTVEKRFKIKLLTHWKLQLFTSAL